MKDKSIKILKNSTYGTMGSNPCGEIKLGKWSAGMLGRNLFPSWRKQKIKKILDKLETNG